MKRPQASEKESGGVLGHLEEKNKKYKRSKLINGMSDISHRRYLFQKQKQQLRSKEGMPVKDIRSSSNITSHTETRKALNHSGEPDRNRLRRRYDQNVTHYTEKTRTFSVGIYPQINRTELL